MEGRQGEAKPQVPAPSCAALCQAALRDAVGSGPAVGVGGAAPGCSGCAGPGSLALAGHAELRLSARRDRAAGAAVRGAGPRAGLLSADRGAAAVAPRPRAAG